MKKTNFQLIHFLFRSMIKSIAMLFILGVPIVSHAFANFDLYNFIIVASTGTNGITSINDGVSIDNIGNVAFAASVSGGQSIFVGDGTGVIKNIAPGFVRSNLRYNRSVQINNHNKIIAQDLVTGPLTRLKLWDANLLNTATTIAKGGLARTDDYDAVFGFASVNNRDQVVFSALKGAQNVLVTVGASKFNEVPFSGVVRPRIADTGDIVVKIGLKPNDPIQLYNYALSSPQTIADGSSFSALGNSPGISNDGSIIVFAGDRGAGPGIFASLAVGGARQVVRVAGEAKAPTIPTLINLPDLGFDDSGLPMYFSNVDLTNRVGVAHYPGGSPGLAGDSFIVAFLATPNGVSDPETRAKPIPGIFFNNNPGLFTVRVDIISTSPLKIKTHVAQPVMQVGSQVQIGAKTITITALQLSDPINVATTDDSGNPLTYPIGSHRLAFWATDGTNNYVFRASQLNACLLPAIRLGQAESPWTADKYAGHPQVTLRNTGCALSALTVAANRAAVDYGIDGINDQTDPGKFNSLMIAKNGFVGKNVLGTPGVPPKAKIVNWMKGVQILRKPGQLFSAATNSLRFEPLKLSTLVPTEAKAARDYVSNSVCDPVTPTPVIVGTDFVKDSDGNFVPEHYVVVTGIVNDRFVVADVGYRGVSTLDDPTPHGVVPKVHNYHNNFETRGRLVDPVDLSSLTVAADEGVDFIVTDALGHRVGYDGVTKLVFKEIPGSAFFIDAMRDIPSEQPASATTRSAILAQIAAGNFTIAVRGRVTGPFAIQISGIDSNGSDHPNIEISDTIISGGLKTYGIAYSSNPGIGTKLVSTIVPHVVGQTQISAASAINGSGLTVGAITTQSSGTIPAGLVISQNPAAAAAVSAASPVNLVISSGSGLVTIPNVVGLSQATAVKAITDAGLTLGTVTTQPSTTIAAGNIITENPAAGTLVSAGSKVSLIVSTGPVLVVVPNVVGSSQSAATTAITGVGLKLGTVTTQASTTVAAGNVISESPAASTSVAAGSSVNLVVSSGPAPVAVPNVVGLSQAAASTAITTAGLNLGTVTTQASSTVPAGIVISESPAVGTLVVKGSSVNLVLSSGPLAGDVNGDGVISCTDATLIKTTFGKRTGQVGFDVRADINKDGVIDVRDLAFVTQRLPAGTKCP